MRLTGVLLLLFFVLSTSTIAAPVPVPRESRVEIQQCPFASLVPGCADLAKGIIYVNNPDDRWTMLHERGHLVDYQRFLGRDRAFLTRLLGFPAETRWLKPPEPSGYYDGTHMPGELFADAYAACAMRLRPDRGLWVIGYGYRPSSSDHARMCGWLLWAKSNR